MFAPKLRRCLPPYWDAWRRHFGSSYWPKLDVALRLQPVPSGLFFCVALFFRAFGIVSRPDRRPLFGSPVSNEDIALQPTARSAFVKLMLLADYADVDSVQMEWLERDLSHVPATMPIVTFNHIPLISSWTTLIGYDEDPLVATLATVNGKKRYRHTVSNVLDVLEVLPGHRYVLALGVDAKSTSTTFRSSKRGPTRTAAPESDPPAMP